VLTWTAIGVVIVLVIGLVSVVWTVHRSFPQTSGTITLDGLSAPVTVIRDDHGIPQVYADTSDDLFYAQGYVQAQDRFFEMDFRRHVTAGRLAELFGDDALETDELVRTMGWRDVAERELPLLSTDTREYLDAFSAGVNAYLAGHDGSQVSLEYAALGLNGVDYTPEKWTPVDSLAWLKAMAWDLGGNVLDEMDRSLESVDLARDQIAELYPDYPYATHQPIVNQGAIVDGVFEPNARKNDTRLPERPAYLSRSHEAMLRARDSTDALDQLLGATGGGLGSNAWAVSGKHTASGAPILANDPHLGATMPSVWYQMGLHCNEVNADCPFDVTGFTFSGVPGVIIGHNQSIAWGFTNLNPDVQDLYLEKVLDDDHVLYDGKPEQLATREERFEVQGGDPVTITVRTSRHGPLISDVSDDFSTVGADAPVPGKKAPPRDNGYAVALRWTALEPARTADAIFIFDKATDWDQFRDGARLFAVPAQNLVYADVEGHIGYQAPGSVPIRRTGDGNWPVPGWDPAYEWADATIPFDALPSVLDPKDGYVITANQAVARKNYPYYLGSSFDYGYRSERIRNLLTSSDDLTVDDMQRIQLDTYSELAHRLTPYLLDIQLPGGYARSGQNALRNWDFTMPADSGAAAYFNVVWRNLLADTFHDDLPEDSWPDGDSRWWAVVEKLLDDPDNAFWDDRDTNEVETRDDILEEALLDARDELTEIQSRDPHTWQWGKIHQLNLVNPTLGDDSSPVRFMFNRGRYELGGAPSLVNAISWDASEGSYDVTTVPSMRMVVPLDDLDASRWINLTGASGHAYNDHYTDQTRLWADGETMAWFFTRKAIDDAGGETLTLQPSD
jgi:penicillin amidase